MKGHLLFEGELKRHHQCGLGGIMMDDYFDSLPYAKVGEEATKRLGKMKNQVKSVRSGQR